MTDRIRMTRAELQDIIERAIPDWMDPFYAKPLRKVGENAKMVARGTFSARVSDSEQICHCPMGQAFGPRVRPNNIKGGAEFVHAFDSITRPSVEPGLAPPNLIEVVDEPDDSV